MIYVLWAVVLFFAATWTLGVVTQPHMRLKSTVSTVILWWACIVLVALSMFSPWHLLWLMPLAVFAPVIFMQMEISSRMTTSLASVLVKSALVVGLGVAAVIFLSQA